MFHSWGHFTDEFSWSGIWLKDPYVFSGPAINCLKSETEEILDSSNESVQKAMLLPLE